MAGAASQKSDVRASPKYSPLHVSKLYNNGVLCMDAGQYPTGPRLSSRRLLVIQYRVRVNPTNLMIAFCDGLISYQWLVWLI